MNKLISDIKVTDILYGYDFKLSFVLFIVSLFVPIELLKCDSILRFLEITITATSILFPILLTTATIFILLPDKKFILFCNEKGDFDKLLQFSSWSLLMLFISLIFSILYRFGLELYMNTPFHGENSNSNLFSIFIFLTFYSLLCTVDGAFGALRILKVYLDYLRVLSQSNPT